MTLLISLALGIVLGYKKIIKESLGSFMRKFFAYGFFIMLVFLGAKIFTSKEVVESIGSIGLIALLFAVFASISAVFITISLLGWLNPKYKNITIENGLTKKHSPEIKQVFGPIIAIGIGAAIGILRPGLPIDYDVWIYRLLNILIFGIGIDIGFSREELKLIKDVGWLAFLVPLGSLLGGLVGSLLVGMATGIPPLIAIAIGAGSGFYSVTAPLVAQVAGPKFGALVLLANFLRETITITLLPLIALRFKHMALVTIGGATTMDVTLPVIARSLGPKIAMVALAQGAILTFLIPFILPIILRI